MVMSPDFHKVNRELREEMLRLHYLPTAQTDNPWPEPEMIDITPKPETKEVKFIGSNKKWGKQ